MNATLLFPWLLRCALITIVAIPIALPAQNAVTPPAAYSVGGTFDPARGLVIFGGFQRGLYAGDTWEFRAGHWNRMSGTNPSPRNGPVMVYDAARHQILLFGGDTRFTGPLGDTWVRDSTHWRQVVTEGPPARSVFAMTYDATRARVVLFGGSGATGLLNDTWEWDGSRWARRATDGPPARMLHALAFDPVRGRVVLFGGKPSVDPDAPPFADTWEWDGSTWHRMTVAGPPGGRDHHAMHWDPTRQMVVLYGGSGPNGEHGTESWGYDGTTWRQLQLDGPRRLFPVLTLDQQAGSLLLYGGFDNQPSNDLFRLGSKAWTPVPIP